MEVIYKAIDGKTFSDKDKCENHENHLLRMKKIFDKLVDQKFFPNYKIYPFIHNTTISDLGNPRKESWSFSKRGYVRMSGRMGNGDTIVSFKLRNNKLLIFRYDTDDYDFRTRRTKKVYLGSIIVNERLEKLKKIMEGCRK